MYSKLKPMSFMGVSNSEMFISEKDLSSSAMEFSFLVRPAPLEFQEDHQCQTAPAPFQDAHHDDDQPQQQQKQEDDKCKLPMAAAPLLDLKLPCSSGEFEVHDQNEGDEDQNNDDGFKTPTSLDHKIPVMLKCPPAPRKPKSLPISSSKRKAFGRRILLDLTKEIESLFPPALLADLGNKIKKVRQGSDFK